jgi:hypothetical protein
MGEIAAMTPGSYQDKRAAIQRAMYMSRSLKEGPIPDQRTLAAYEQRWDHGRGKLLSLWYDRRRCGRPEKEFPSLVSTAITDEARFLSKVSHVHRAAAKAAEVHVREEAQRAGTLDRMSDAEIRAAAAAITPSYGIVLSRVSDLGPAARSAGRHGSRAAEIDSLPYGTIVAEHTHDVHTLDECFLPRWIRVWEPKLNGGEGGWVSALPSLIPVRDVKSDASIGWHIADPGRRVDSETRLRMRSGFDADDVLATLLTVAIPDLAPPSTRHLAGYLPRTLRFDNHSTHKTVRGMFSDETADMLRIPRLPKERPINRGDIEREIATLKGLCAGRFAHVDLYVPTDQLTEEPSRERTRIAATLDRATRQTPVAPEDLPDIDMVRRDFDEDLARANRTAPGPDALSPEQRYRKHLARRDSPDVPLDGDELITILEPKTVIATGEGVVIERDYERHAFRLMKPGLWIPPGATVTYRADPLLRGIWVDVEGTRVFFPPAEVTGRLLGPKTIARAQRAVARVLSDEAADIKQLTDIVAMGAVAYARSQESAKEEIKHAKAAKAAKPTPAPNVAPGSGTPTPRPGGQFRVTPGSRFRQNGPAIGPQSSDTPPRTEPNEPNEERE